MKGGAMAGRRDGGTVAIFANQLLKFERRTHAFAAEGLLISLSLKNSPPHLGNEARVAY
jgi:hypothetical protein